MQLTPRYGERTLITFDLPVGDPSVPTLRQRRRLAELLAGLDERQWSAASRCEGWAVRDVVAHLVGTNRFWTYSITSGLAGEPTRVLTSFDPVATPKAMVESMSAQTPAELLAQFNESNDGLAEVIGDLEPDQWSTLAEAPPGHLALDAVVFHALWDGWVHERDVMLPLGLEPALEVDELTGTLLYVSALGPAILASQGSDRTGTLAVAASASVPHFVVEVGPAVVVRRGPAPDGTATLAGDAVDLIESLSYRGPPPEIAAADRWMVDGLGRAFGVVTGT